MKSFWSGSNFGVFQRILGTCQNILLFPNKKKDTKLSRLIWYVKSHGKYCRVGNNATSSVWISSNGYILLIQYSRNHMKFLRFWYVMLSIITPVILKHSVSQKYANFLVNAVKMSSQQIFNDGHFKVFFVIYRQLLFNSDAFAKVFPQMCFIFKKISGKGFDKYRFLLALRS